MAGTLSQHARSPVCGASTLKWVPAARTGCAPSPALLSPISGRPRGRRACPDTLVPGCRLPAGLPWGRLSDPGCRQGTLGSGCLRSAFTQPCSPRDGRLRGGGCRCPWSRAGAALSSAVRPRHSRADATPCNHPRICRRFGVGWGPAGHRGRRDGPPRSQCRSSRLLSRRMSPASGRRQSWIRRRWSRGSKSTTARSTATSS